MNLYDNLNKMMAYIEEHIEEKIERNVLAKFLGCSAYTMQRIFSMVIDLPFLIIFEEDECLWLF